MTVAFQTKVENNAIAIPDTEKKLMNDNLVFFDANILVYSYSVTDKDKYEKAIEVMGDSYCYISTQVISEFCNVLIRKMRFNPLKVKELTRGFEL
jgi:predicted nucleic acid-binding protein